MNLADKMKAAATRARQREDKRIREEALQKEKVAKTARTSAARQFTKDWPSIKRKLSKLVAEAVRYKQDEYEVWASAGFGNDYTTYESAYANCLKDKLRKEGLDARTHTTEHRPCGSDPMFDNVYWTMQVSVKLRSY